MRDTPYISASPEREPTYSERKAEGRYDGIAWPLEQLVQAQQMECAGATHEEIAEAFGCGLAEVREKLQPPEASRQRPRQERASMGFASMKRSR